MKIMKKIIFYIYALFLFIFIVLKFHGSFYEIYDRIKSLKYNRESGIWNCNMVLFKNIKAEMEYVNNFWALKNLMGNVVVFVPLGFLIPFTFPGFSKFYRTFLICEFTILFIEIIQFITMLGFFDVDDIFLNSLGCVTGYAGFKIYCSGHDRN